jgi:hypothetical protein
MGPLYAARGLHSLSVYDALARRGKTQTGGNSRLRNHAEISLYGAHSRRQDHIGAGEITFGGGAFLFNGNHSRLLEQEGE